MKKLMAIGISLLLSTAAAAQDSGEFDGFYVGGVVSTAPAGNNDRFEGAALAGYRFEAASNLIVGVETQGSLGFDTLRAPYVGAQLTGQVGAVVGGNVLLFAQAGVAVEDYTDNTFLNPPATTSAVAGVGVEFAANEAISLRMDAVGFRRLEGRDVPAARGSAGVVFKFN
ncbi:MAG TPA: outer membrane beta-barrel protein [Devosia sp.]|nr:outer membrane beta-barrel protein [Devosia sp.]